MAEVAMRPVALPSPLHDPQEWLSRERFIEVDDPSIVALARTLQQTTSWQTARVIYQWVSQNIRYSGYIADDLGAARALRDLRGDCTEFADLTVALARACGIPARMVGGFVVDNDAAPRPQDYHNWAELYLDGAWQLVDTQKQRWMNRSDGYICFRIYRDASINEVGAAHRYRLDGQLRVVMN